MHDCIFCKIVKGEIPNYTVYEDDHVLAFLDIHPQAPGHTVLVPKLHAERFFDLNEEVLKHVLPAVQKTMERIERVLNPDGYNVGWNDAEAAGQAVPHMHFHILPRYQNDGGGSMHSIVNNTKGKRSPAELAQLFS